MADETTNKSNREQVVIVILHVDIELVADEDFIGFNKVDLIDATTLTGVIKGCQLRMNLSLNNCRCQCYDRASICLEQSLEWPNKFQMKGKEQFILIVMDMPQKS